MKPENDSDRSAGVPPASMEGSPRGENLGREEAHSDCSAGVLAVSGASPSRWAWLIATFFGVGRQRPGPGTWASIATVLLWALASWRIPVGARAWATIAAALVVTLIGIPAATRVARASGQKDPQCVVIDEVAGQLIALIAVPLAWKTFLAGLILFRTFDILKPPPLRQLERLPEGIGIVVDDVGAGLYALICMHLLIHFGLLIQ